MAAGLSSVFNAQFLTDTGALAASYRLYTYVPGTTTQKIAYTDAAASVPHTYTNDGSGGQYIPLNARGEVTGGMYLTSGGCDLCLKTPAGATVWTKYAEANGLELRADLANTTDSSDGDALIGVKASGTGAVSRTQHAKNSDLVSIADYDTLQHALDASPAVYVPAGTWPFALGTTLPDNADIWGPGTLQLQATAGLSATVHYAIDATNADNWRISVRRFDGNRSNLSGSAGFKVRGVLCRGSTDFEFEPSMCSNWHDGVIEATSASQSNPVNAYTPPASQADTIYRGRIRGFLASGCGRAVDDGPGYSFSKVVEIGSETQSIAATNITIYNCAGGGVVAGAYNRDILIDDIEGYNDNPSDARTYASDLVAVEQLSRSFIIGAVSGRGWKQLENIESAIGGTIGPFYGEDVVNGVSMFASNIGATPTDLGRITVAGGHVKCRSTASGTFGFRAVKSSGNDAYDITVGVVTTEGGEFGIQLNGITRGSAACLTATGAGNGINIGACVDFLVAAWNAVGNTNEGLYCAAGNNRVTIRGGRASGNGTYGLDVAAGQTDLRIYDNDLNGANGTKDFRIASYATNNVRHRRNKYATESGTIKTLSGATPSVKFTGPISYFANGGATTVTNLTDGEIGEPYVFQASDANTTIQHGTNIYCNTGANIGMAANRALTLMLNYAAKWAQIG